MMHDLMPLANPAAGSELATFQRTAMPFEPGYASAVVGAESVPKTLANGPYAYGVMTHLKYLSSAFAGWKGGIRYAVDVSTVACCDRSQLMIATAYSNCTPKNKIIPNLVVTTNAGMASMLNGLKEESGWEGATVHQPNINGVVTFEIPFYSRYRFAPTRLYTAWDDGGQFDFAPCWKLACISSAGPSTNQFFTSFVAAGDDFTCSFFVGAPPMHIESIVPSA